MKSCYFCKASKPSFAFPSKSDEVDIWCTMLGIEPPAEISKARICQDHFSEDSYFFNSRGHKRLKKKAKPMKISINKFDHEQSVFLISQENVKIPAHKCFIAATCSNLKPLLETTSEDCDISIYFHGYSHRVIKAFLEALYCGSQNISSTSVEEMKEFLLEIGCSLLCIGNANDKNDRKDREDEAGDVLELEEIDMEVANEIIELGSSNVVLAPRVKRSIMEEGETEEPSSEKSFKFLRKYRITLTKCESKSGRNL